MKKGFYKIVFVLIALVTFFSCKKEYNESQFDEFEITDTNGLTRTGGIYLPKGMNSRSVYPVIFMEDGLVFKETHFKHMVDSLIEYGLIRPVIIACSYENKMTIPGYKIAYRNAEYLEAMAQTDSNLAKIFDDHYTYFKQVFIPYINKNYPVSTKISDRIFFGTSNSADFGITLSMRDEGLFSEFWCYSPVYSDINEYGTLESPVIYRICWGNKEEIGMFDYFPSLIKDIRKRGGDVSSWTYNGGHDREWWKYWFGEELVRRFPYKK